MRRTFCSASSITASKFGGIRAIPVKQIAYCLFETPLGSCGIAWRDPGNSAASPAVTFLQLPEETAELTERRIARNSGVRESSEPPVRIAEVIEKVRKHL